uniref:Cul n 5 allergen n=1 Tax=Culicoides nubeculosus TaxID=144565 RepID=D9IL15_CULNU|nr:Cul n 5 allergen [Culicoides nubeculosus]
MKFIMEFFSIIFLLSNLLVSARASSAVGTSRELYNPDPKAHIRGDTYEEITRFNQVYFTQEATFGSCNSKCEDYAEPRDNFKEDEAYKFPQRLCTGTIHSCKSEYSPEYHVRLPKSPTSDARYYYFSKQIGFTGELYIYGNKKEPEYRFEIFKGWERVFVRCDICRCLCDEPEDKNSVRSFSLNTVTADKGEHKVVTGIQIGMKDKIFFLKIQQSPLLPFGRINSAGSSWKADDPSSSGTKLFKLQYNKRGIHMGAAEANVKLSEYVVTAVKFVEHKGNMALGVELTQFDISTGKLLENSKWTYNSFATNIIADGNSGHRPTAYSDHVPSEKTKLGLVQFSQSHMHDDVGQSTVPFIDLQAITSTESALIGVGLLFRGREFSGGFIAPSLITHPIFSGETKGPRK